MSWISFAFLFCQALIIIIDIVSFLILLSSSISFAFWIWQFFYYSRLQSIFSESVNVFYYPRFLRISDSVNRSLLFSIMFAFWFFLSSWISFAFQICQRFFIVLDFIRFLDLSYFYYPRFHSLSETVIFFLLSSISLAFLICQRFWIVLDSIRFRDLSFFFIILDFMGFSESSFFFFWFYLLFEFINLFFLLFFISFNFCICQPFLLLAQISFAFWFCQTFFSLNFLCLTESIISFIIDSLFFWICHYFR